MAELISVIIPIFNTKEYLETCVNSVRMQQYKNLEIILVDDGSEAETAELCDLLAAKDERVRVHHQKNGGLSAARNAGLDLATGEYIVFVDSDDYLHPQMIQRLYDALKANQADVSVCDYERVGVSEGKAASTVVLSTEKKETVYEGTELFDRIYGADYVKYIVCWNKLYRRELLEGIWFPQGRIHEDEYFTPRVIQRAQKGVWIDEKMYYYVIREGSLSKSGLEKSSRHKLECMKENAYYFRGIGQSYAYQKESIRYLRGIIYFSGQFYKSKPVDKKRLNELHEEFKEYYGKYDGPVADRFHRLNFWLFSKMYKIYLGAFAAARMILRK